MQSILNAQINVELDGRLARPAITTDEPSPRGYFATTSFACDVKLDEPVTTREGFHLSAELYGVDEGDDRTLISPLQWADTVATGGIVATGIYRIYSSTPAGTISFKRTSYIAENLLDEDPAAPLFAPWGTVYRRRGDELLVLFTLTKYTYNGLPRGEVVATGEARTSTSV